MIRDARWDFYSFAIALNDCKTLGAFPIPSPFLPPSREMCQHDGNPLWPFSLPPEQGSEVVKMKERGESIPNISRHSVRILFWHFTGIPPRHPNPSRSGRLSYLSQRDNDRFFPFVVFTKWSSINFAFDSTLNFSGAAQYPARLLGSLSTRTF